MTKYETIGMSHSKNLFFFLFFFYNNIHEDDNFKITVPITFSSQYCVLLHLYIIQNLYCVSYKSTIASKADKGQAKCYTAHSVVIAPEKKATSIKDITSAYRTKLVSNLTISQWTISIVASETRNVSQSWGRPFIWQLRSPCNK